MTQHVFLVLAPSLAGSMLTTSANRDNLQHPVAFRQPRNPNKRQGEGQSPRDLPLANANGMCSQHPEAKVWVAAAAASSLPNFSAVGGMPASSHHPGH